MSKKVHDLKGYKQDGRTSNNGLANRENLQFFAKELAGQIVEGKINATISERLEIPENNIDQELDHRVTKDNKKGLQ